MGRRGGGGEGGRGEGSGGGVGGEQVVNAVKTGLLERSAAGCSWSSEVFYVRRVQKISGKRPGAKVLPKYGT